MQKHGEQPNRRFIDRGQYEADFPGPSPLASESTAIATPSDTSSKRERALEHALDIRKFEIDLYWKRANHFWTFIAATFAGYAAIQAINDDGRAKADLSVFLACLGVVLSVGWFFANKGSKQWQENWENHVDLLEDDVIGPLYKTVLRRSEIPGRSAQQIVKGAATGPGSFSVSKINQIISLFVVLLWVGLLFRALLPFSLQADIDWLYVVAVATTAATCLLIYRWGKTDEGMHSPTAERRETMIIFPHTDTPVAPSSKNVGNELPSPDSNRS